jgi:transposase InsO family protein
VLYCFFVIEHHRRRILHFNTTAHPTSEWIVQQLREAFPLPRPYRYVVFAGDRKFAGDVRGFLKASGVKPVRTSARSPWQNGVAEWWVANIRREMLDHVIALNEQHLMRLGHEYVRYYHGDRIHIGLGKQTPGGRLIEQKANCGAKFASTGDSAASSSVHLDKRGVSVADARLPESSACDELQ